MFRTRELVMSADLKEILKFMLGSNKNLSNRLMIVLKDICSLIGVNHDLFLRKPIECVMKAFSFTSYPMLCFRKMMEEYVSHRVNYSIDLMISEIDMGNAKDNLLVLYAERANPSMLLKPLTRSSLTDTKELFVTWIGMCREPKKFPFKACLKMTKENKEDTIIHVSDLALDRAIKALNYLDQRSDFVFHRSFPLRVQGGKDNIIHCYTDLMDLYLMKTNHADKKLDIQIFSRDKGKTLNTSSIIKYLNADIRAEGATNYVRRWFTSEGVFFEKKVTEISLNFRTEFDLSSTNWTMFITAFTNERMKFLSDKYEGQGKELKFRVVKDTYYIHNNRLFDLEDYVEDDNFVVSYHQFIHRDFDLMGLQKFLKTNNMFDENPIHRYVKVKEKVNPKMKSFKQDMMDSGSSTVFETMMNMISFEAVDESLDTIEKVVTSEFQYNDSLLGPEDVSKLQKLMMMTEDNDRELSNVLPKERVHITRMIMDNLIKAMEKEIEWNNKTLDRLFDIGKKNREVGMDVIWEIILTNLHRMYPEMDDWMLRLCIAYVYSKISRQKDIKKPDMIGIYPDDYVLTYLPFRKLNNMQMEIEVSNLVKIRSTFE
jgi:hypothetical protein